MSLICAIELVAVKQKAPVSDGRGFFSGEWFCVDWADAIASRLTPTGILPYTECVFDAD
jgi:hypothetical protein